MRTAKKLLLFTAPLLAMACGQSEHQTTSKSQRTEFFDKSGMDTTIRPGDNFFLYANGKWLNDTEIPASQTGWGSFYVLDDGNMKNLRIILDSASAAKTTRGADAQKVGDFYASGLDTAAMDKRGYDPVKPVLTQIATLNDYKALVNFAADQFKEGHKFLFSFSVGPDDKISDKNAVTFHQTGLGLPNRDYYFNKDAATLNIRKEYVNFITRLLTLSGTDSVTARKNADGILRLETEIAKSHFTPVELRDPQKNYNKFAVEYLQKQSPELNINALLQRFELKVDTVLVAQPRYYRTLAGLLKSQPLSLWKEKLRFEALKSAAPALSQPFRQAHFNFYVKTLTGQKEQQERWKQMVTQTDQNLGDLLGKLYVEKHFPADAKERMMTLVNNLQKVYEARIENLEWMSAETKKRALEKLNTFVKKIGYTDKWKNYDDVEIVRGKYYENLQSAARHNYKEMVGKMGKPVDRDEWFMTPSTVNAYYNPPFNEIVFPAGILQFPFFDYQADDAINYGAIGSVIGHEMTHGFDDQGRQYDKDGNLKDWWTKEDADKFKKRADVVVNQYNRYTVLDNLPVNGQLTLGENLADIGGVAIAYQAFKLTEQGKSNEIIDGFTPDQRFFLSYAQVWRIKNRDERLRMRITLDPHSPEMFRVNGPLSNMPEFYKAFNVTPGDKMYRPEAERVKVW